MITFEIPGNFHPFVVMLMLLELNAFLDKSLIHMTSIYYHKNCNVNEECVLIDLEEIKHSPYRCCSSSSVSNTPYGLRESSKALVSSISFKCEGGDDINGIRPHKVHDRHHDRAARTNTCVGENVRLKLTLGFGPTKLMADVTPRVVRC